MRILTLLLLLLAPSAIAQPLPSDPRLVTGELDNGLRYIIRRHDNPPARASIWLHVSSGSLNETDRQRGVAHFLEHMAFNGSENFPPGSVIPFFQSMGLTFGVHQNAFTSFDQTVYQLALPDAKPETISRALLFLSDVAFRLDLLPDEIEKERQIILEEKRATLGGRQRVSEYLLERWAPGSLIGERLPIGTEKTILGMTADDFRDYYRSRYVPANMTVIAVADADPADLIGPITDYFSDGREKAPAPADADPRVKPYTSARALVASDPELASAQIGFMRVAAARPAVLDVAAVREDLVESVATWIFNRRLRNLVSAGAVAFQGGGASTGDLFGAIRLIDVSVNGEPSRWRSMLNDLGAEVRRAVLHGFTDRELDDARKALLAAAEHAVAAEPTAPARAILAGINQSVADGEPVLSAAQELELTRSLLPTLTVPQISDAFRLLFDAGTRDRPPVTFVLQIPSSADVPDEATLLELGSAALAGAPAVRAEADRPASLLDGAPTPGEIVESSLHEPSAVWSAWLSNGVRMHHRFMDYRKDQVTVTISLAAGEIQESPETRGRAEVAALAWQRPATSRLSSTNIRDLMTGKNASAVGRHGMDTMAVMVTGTPTDLEEGLKLAHLMLTDPVIEPALFDQWREQQKQLLALRPLQLEFVFFDLYVDTVYPKGDARHRPLSAEQIDAITPAAAQAWLRDQITAAPIEVTVVGDIDRERAADLVRTYIGSLPPRDRTGPGLLADLRHLERPAGPLDARAQVDTQTDKAMVLCGFFGADSSNVRDTRLLNLASRILSTRMIETLREERQLVYSIGVSSSPAQEFPGFGTVMAFSSTAPDKVAPLIDAVGSMYAAFAAEGPTADEMEVVRRQLANTLDERMREPGFWTGVLATLTYRDTSIQDAVDAPAAYQAFTADEVREAFARYYSPQTTITVAVSPGAPPE